MRSKNHAWLTAMMGVLVLVLSIFGCGCGTSSPPPPAIRVSVSAGATTVKEGATTQVTATVANDSANQPSPQATDICHQYDLKHHEQELISGYRAGTWKAGFPHLSAETRAMFQRKIGTVTWQTILDRWPELATNVEL